MGLVRSFLPFNAPSRSLPVDALMSFGSPSAPAPAPVTLTASGWMPAPNPTPNGAGTISFVNLGQPLSNLQLGQVTGVTPAQVLGNAGRVQGYWVISPSAANLTLADDTFYQFYLYGSNDANFTAGNCELLGTFDIAANAAQRLGFPAGQAAAFPGGVIGGAGNYPNVPSPPASPVPIQPGGPYFVGGAESAGATTPFLSSTFVRPFSNESDVFNFQFLAMFVEVGGTAPSITLSSWIVPAITGGPKI
jgi:hypothetical protein